MSTNTYRLAVALQAKAIESIDLHDSGVYTAAHTFGDHITVVERYRTAADQRILQMWARDADAHLLGSAEAIAPPPTRCCGRARRPPVRTRFVALAPRPPILQPKTRQPQRCRR